MKVTFADNKNKKSQRTKRKLRYTIKTNVLIVFKNFDMKNTEEL